MSKANDRLWCMKNYTLWAMREGRVSSASAIVLFIHRLPFDSAAVHVNEFFYVLLSGLVF